MRSTPVFLLLAVLMQACHSPADTASTSTASTATVATGATATGPASTVVAGTGAADASSPEAAVLRLEKAFRARDVRAAIAAKDFDCEARDLIAALPNVKGPVDGPLVSQVAGTLEAEFRTELTKDGFPSMDGIQCSVVKSEVSGDRAIVTEHCVRPDGSAATQRLKVCQTATGWRGAVVVD